MLVYISAVNSPRTIVLLLGHDPDVSLDLLGVLAISCVIDLKVPNISHKLGLNNTNRYLALVSNVELGDTYPGIRLLYVPR